MKKDSEKKIYKKIAKKRDAKMKNMLKDNRYVRLNEDEIKEDEIDSYFLHM